MSRLVQLHILVVMATITFVLLLTSQAKANPLDITATSTLETVTDSSSTTPTTTKTQTLTCQNYGACGWGVYGDNNNKKKIKYFIRNTCRCAPQLGCLLEDEDLSLAAFIYRCKERKPTTNSTTQTTTSSTAQST